MSKRVDRTRFLSDPIRLRIAELCRDQPRTRAELATALGRDAGSLSQPRTMANRGALEERSRAKASDGRPAKVYRLKKSWQPALKSAREQQQPAWPEDGQDLLLIPLANTADACAAIARGIPDIEWGAPVRGGAAGIVIAPLQGRNGAGTLRVLKALGGVAPQIMALHLGAPMSASALREWSRQVDGKELPPGS